MPPRLPQTAARRPGTLKLYSKQFSNSSCLICASAALTGQKPTRRKRAQSLFQTRSSARGQSTQVPHDSGEGAASPARTSPSLKATLNELQKNFRSYVNLSRLQLALRALEQKPGEETIRIAILGLSGQEKTSEKVRQLTRLLLADPLKEEEDWERLLTCDSDPGRPILLRIGENSDSADHGINSRLIQELSISSPTLNSHRLEVLIMQADNFSDGMTAQEDIADSILVPSVEIPVSSTGKYTPITTPVHKALVVGDGILGASSLAQLPIETNQQIITAAVDLPGLICEQRDQMPFQLIDTCLACSALASFRENSDNAMSYEHDWFKSGVSDVLDWVKAGTLDTPGGPMKSPVQALILSVLTDANQQIQYEESRQLSAMLVSKVSFTSLDSLRNDLCQWAQRAHTELRDQLDIAFEGRRWHRLGWWKLFWRVDDISMIALDILNQRFLTDAEQEIIYLAGKIEEAGVFKDFPTIQESHWAYKPIIEEEKPTGLISSPPSLHIRDLVERPQEDMSMSIKPKPWPLHIPLTRSYLSIETVPALQALAQKLVMQTLTTSSFVSTFAGLLYISSLSTGLYESGAVAAFGVIWSLRRMQKKWETARKFWEDEVREEGRKAVRAVESSVSNVLARPSTTTIEGAEELQRARNAVEEAREAFGRESSHLDS